MKLIEIYDARDAVYYTAENQEWSKEALKELADIDIFFMQKGDGVHAVRIIDRHTKGEYDPLIQIGTEDDGTISFFKHEGQFAVYWLGYLLAELKNVAKIIKQRKSKLSNSASTKMKKMYCCGCGTAIVPDKDERYICDECGEDKTDDISSGYCFICKHRPSENIQNDGAFDCIHGDCLGNLNDRGDWDCFEG